MDRSKDRTSGLQLAQQALETRRAALERFADPSAKLQDLLTPQIAQLEAAASAQKAVQREIDTLLAGARASADQFRDILEPQIAQLEVAASAQKAFQSLAVDRSEIDALFAGARASADHFRDLLGPQIAQAAATPAARGLFERLSADVICFSKVDLVGEAMARRDAGLAKTQARILEAMQPASAAAEAFYASMAKNAEAIEELQRYTSPAPQWEIESVPQPWLQPRPVGRKPADDFLAQVKARITTWRASLPEGKASFERLLFQGFAIDEWSMSAVDADLIAVHYQNEDGEPVEVLVAPAAIAVELSAEDEETIRVELRH